MQIGCNDREVVELAGERPTEVAVEGHQVSLLLAGSVVMRACAAASRRRLLADLPRLVLALDHRLVPARHRAQVGRGRDPVVVERLDLVPVDPSLTAEEFLLLLLPLGLFVDQLLVDVNVLVGHLLRDLLRPDLLDDLRLDVLHEEGVSRCRVHSRRALHAVRVAH